MQYSLAGRHFLKVLYVSSFAKLGSGSSSSKNQHVVPQCCASLSADPHLTQHAKRYFGIAQGQSTPLEPQAILQFVVSFHASMHDADRDDQITAISKHTS
eukprot:878213-Amphidinium_carterae.1